MLKKFILAIAMFFGVSAAFAGNYGSVTVETVKDDKTHAESLVEYYRIGKGMGWFNLDLTARNARAEKNGALSNSLEVGMSSGTGSLFWGAGVGHDFAAKQTQYGFATVGLGQKMGVLNANAGLRFRTGFADSNPTQLLAFAGVSMPVAKGVAVDAGFSRSYKDIKETGWNAGLKFDF